MDNDLKLWQALVMAARAFADTLEAKMSASAETVKHGKWEYRDDDIPCCSICGEPDALSRDDYEHRGGKIRDNNSLFCSNCGAKMDGDASETQDETPTETAQKDEPKKEIILPEVRALLAEKSRAGFSAEVKALLKKHGSPKLSGIAESEYAALMEEAENLGN